MVEKINPRRDNERMTALHNNPVNMAGICAGEGVFVQGKFDFFIAEPDTYALQL